MHAHVCNLLDHEPFTSPIATVYIPYHSGNWQLANKKVHVAIIIGIVYHVPRRAPLVRHNLITPQKCDLW